MRYLVLVLVFLGSAPWFYFGTKFLLGTLVGIERPMIPMLCSILLSSSATCYLAWSMRPPPALMEDSKKTMDDT
jgi:hypothetical protein